MNSRRKISDEEVIKRLVARRSVFAELRQADARELDRKRGVRRILWPGIYPGQATRRLFLI